MGPSLCRPRAGTLPSHLGGALSSFFHPCPHCPPSPRHSGLLTLCLAWPENPSPPGRQQIIYHQGVHLPYAGPFTHFFFPQFSLIAGRVSVKTPTLQMERLRLRMKQLLRSHPDRKVSGEPGDSPCWNSFPQAVAQRERKEIEVGKIVNPLSRLSALAASSFSAQGAGTGNRG